MSTPVADHTATIFFIVSPVREHITFHRRCQFFIINIHRSRADPHFPIQRFRNRLCRQIVLYGRRSDGYFHFLDLTDIAVANQLAGMAEVTPRTLHITDLQYTVVLFHGIGHSTAFFDTMRHRLLYIDIFSGTTSFYRLYGMPMVGGCYNHTVYITPVQ